MKLRSIAGLDPFSKRKRGSCALRTCPNTGLMRILPKDRIGICVDQDWYCSVGCFFEATYDRFSSLSYDRIAEMPHTPRFPIGLALLAKGFLTEEQLRFASAQSNVRGEELEVVLPRLGLADEWQLTAARAAQWGVPVLGQDHISSPVNIDIPVTLLRAYSAAPLHYSASSKRLLLGFVHRVEHGLLISLEKICQCSVEPCFITPTGFAEQMARLSPVADCEERVFEEDLTPPRMAKTLARIAQEVSASEARFAHFRNLEWARLTGKRHNVDVLFRGKIEAETENAINSQHFEESIRSLG